jgi:hypothetical protein
LNLIRANDDSAKRVRWRKMRASYNQGYREQLLFGGAGGHGAIALEENLFATCSQSLL